MIKTIKFAACRSWVKEKEYDDPFLYNDKENLFHSYKKGQMKQNQTEEGWREEN